MKLVPSALIALAIAAPAAASSPAAWAAEHHRAQAACIAESELVGPAVTPVAGFDDRTALDTMLMTGLLRRGPPLKVTMLCLFDRRAGKAQAIEVRGWPSVRR